jgi:hypothetical protein
MKHRIHVNQHVIKRNAKTGERKPALTVKSYANNRKCHTATIDGPSRVVYSPDKPLACGAVCWVETESEVTVDGG